MAVASRRNDPLLTRHRVTAAAGGLAALALIVRVVYLQTVRAPHYVSLLEKYRTGTVFEMPIRGEILDRNRAPLARTRYIYRIELDPVRFTTLWSRLGADAEERGRERLARLLSGLLGIDRNDVLSRFHEAPGQGETKRQRIIKNEATLAEVQAIEYFLAHRPNDRDRSEPHLLDGIVVRKLSERSVTDGDVSAAILGRTVVGPMGILRGLGGIEQWADAALAGSIGWRSGSVDRSRRLNPLMPYRRASATPGMEVGLTLDAEVQRICARALDACMATHRPIGATAIVMDPHTGDILGMVSRPSVDLQSPDLGAILAKHPEYDRNRALMLYEPGSALKPITVAIALEDGELRDDESIPCSGAFTPGNRMLRCEAHKSNTPAPGTNTPEMIVAKSCNVGVARISLRLGWARLNEGLRNCGFFAQTGIQLYNDQPGYTVVRRPEDVPSRDDIARIGFGQSISISPLALTAVYGALANGGRLIQPRIISYFGAPGSPAQRRYPVHRNDRIFTKEVAEEVRGYLRAVVVRGTGRKVAEVPGYTTAGKTGTAQKVDNGAYRGHIATFVGFVPATKPRAVITVVVDEPSQNGYHGSQAAAPYWKRIAEDLMTHLHVASDMPTTTATRDEASHERR